MTVTVPLSVGGAARLAAMATFGFVAACGGGGGGGGSSTTGPSGTTDQTVASVSITGNTTTVAVGSSITLTASPRTAGGTVLNSAVTWSSSNAAAATVGASTGVVTGVAVGTTTITASAGGFSGTRVITVTTPGTPAPAPSAVTVNMPDTQFEPSTFTVASGGTVTFVFTSLAHTVVFGQGSGVSDIPLTINGSVTRTFNTRGTFSLQCTVHSGMTGVVTVQ